MSQQWDGGYVPPDAPPPGPPGPPGPYGPPGPPVDPNIKNQAITALVCNAVAAVLCCGLPSIGGVICASIAMGKADNEPESAKKLNVWAWVLLVSSFALDILYVIFIFVFPLMFVPLGSTPY